MSWFCHVSGVTHSSRNTLHTKGFANFQAPPYLSSLPWTAPLTIHHVRGEQLTGSCGLGGGLGHPLIARLAVQSSIHTFKCPWEKPLKPKLPPACAHSLVSHTGWNVTETQCSRAERRLDFTWIDQQYISSTCNKVRHYGQFVTQLLNKLAKMWHFLCLARGRWSIFKRMLTQPRSACYGHLALYEKVENKCKCDVDS